MKNTKRAFFIILLYVILLILLLFANNIMELVPSKQSRNTIELVICYLVYIALIYKLFIDMKIRTYTTTVYIVLSDILEIIAFSIFLYLSYKRYTSTDTEALIIKSPRLRLDIAVMIAAEWVRGHFKSPKFLKNSDNDRVNKVK